MSKSQSDGISYKKMVAHTPGATELNINGFILSADASVTGTDYHGNAITAFPFKGGLEYHIKMKTITTVSAGTCYLLN